MTESILSQVLPYESLAVAFVDAKFAYRGVSADQVVQDVLTSLIGKPLQVLSNPKRFLLRACRWRALRCSRPAKVQVIREAGPEILIALEDEDRPKFFGTRGVLDPKEKLRQAHLGETTFEASTTLEFPGAPIRLQFKLVRRAPTGDAA